MKAFLSENPLKSIFKISSKGNITEEIESMNKRDSFFKYIKDEKTPAKLRSQIIEEFIKIIKINRYICEYFSTFENQSIYIFLTELYVNKSTSQELKISIINLINELRINLDINKNIYDYLFQKISLIYREEEKLSSELLHDYLTILNKFVGDTLNNLKPRNYFCCSGEGYFEVDLNKLKLKMGCSLTFILNFKISSSQISKENEEKAHISKLIDITFSNGYNINFDLKYPMFLVVKEIQDKFIKTLPDDEWINLVVNIVNDDKNNINVYCYANGENRLIPFQIKKPRLTNNETVNSIRFFNNFYGEVSSISFLIQKVYGYPGVNVSDFLLEFKQFKEGLWKKKKIDKFFNLLKEFDSIGIEKTKSKTFSKKPTKIEKKFEKIETQTSGKLIDNLVFIFTPINYYENCNNIIENVIGFLNMKFSGNIKPHKYQCFQKRIGNLGIVPNLLPIAEMFVIHPQLLNENNFGLLLEIIKNILIDRKYNIRIFSDCSFFQILSLFIQKYPKNIFTQKILDTFAAIGKSMFGNDMESLNSIYFDNILLNEKILSKYSEDLQIKFWNHILLFCQSDSSQIEVFINMNRICLILRFYDINKYTEMCCQKHLSMIKEEYRGNNTIMNPPMDEKLKSIENIMNVIINAQEPEKAFSLFKLLTLDLSPCLTEFILNIFINAFQKHTTDNKWKDNFIKVLILNKFETIMINTFEHSLPAIKLSLLKLIFEIHYRLTKMNNMTDKLKTLLTYIKQQILPQDNFYSEEKIPYRITISTSINVNASNTTNLKSPGISNLNHTKTFSNKDNQNNAQKTEQEKKQNPFKMLNPNQNIMLKPVKKEDNKKNELKKVKTISSQNKNEEAKKPTTSQNNKISSMISKLEGMGAKFPGMMGRPLPQSNKPKENKENFSKTVFVPNQDSSEKESNKTSPLNKSVFQSTNNSSIVKSESSKGNSCKYKINFKNENNEIIIIKENYYIEYIDNLYKLFLLWTFNIPITFDFNKLDFKTSIIESKVALELLLVLANQINDIDFNMECIKKIELISCLPLNAYRLVEYEKIILSLLDIAYKYYKSKDKKEQKCFEMIKSVILNIYLNSLKYLEKIHSLYPCDKIENILLWGDKILFNNTSRGFKDDFFYFMYEFLFQILTAFKITNEKLMDFNVSKGNYNSNPGSNFYLKNYFILITHLFRFSFNYKHDTIIRTEGMTYISESPKVNNYLISYITGMKMNPLKGKKISEQWLDFPFFDEIYKKVSIFWNKIKEFKIDKKKSKNKVFKYESILEKVILNKEKKNLYQKELELLCFEETVGEKEQIIPLIKIIPIGLMCLIQSSELEADFLYWLKELKRFVRFLIIASSNLIRTNQLELYNQYQEKCLNAIIPIICFFKELLDISNKCKEKIEKGLISIFILCSLIVKHQYYYINKNKGIKKIKKISGKPSRNDLVQCAVFILFSELIKNNSGNPLLDLKEIESLELSQYVKFIQLLGKKEWIEGFLESKILRQKISNDFYTINNYKRIVDIRRKLILNISNDKDERYKGYILSLLPLYEKELLKNSNNSLEINKKIKNKYKRLKKNCFSWNGFWSERKLFFHNSDTLKLKIMNHLTKTLMKPVLVPIIDMAYYLPEFSGFNPSTLFNSQKNASSNSKFKLTMDIDKILKASEQSSIKGIKKNLTEEENFLRNIYYKSYPQLAESLSDIAEKLDFGKEEEFTIIQKDKGPNNKNEKKKYHLSCLVKTSHHIKGVCFIDDKNLNFKVFLNQKTGSAMSGVEIGFTTQDDDYDHERQTCFGSYFICHPKDRDIYKISIKYNTIKWIFRRRYYYKNSALEIFTTTNKTFYFNFKYESEREEVINEILDKLGESAKIIDDLKESKDIFDNVIGFENVSVTDSKAKGKKVKLSKRIEMWKEWKLTNYELLMWLNIYGNRSFNDISQYPVFPWVLNDYKDPLKDESTQEYNIRDMSLPMGMMALDEKGEQRKELFLLNYETLKESGEEMKPYFYGSNYSNPIYVCNYLMRIFPFTHIAIELQGSKFDQPDRLFLSVENSFYNSVTQKTDVRELIPEFFYLPEIFLNINDLNMGVLENGKKVNDITVPCHNNPYEFVLSMRSILESNAVSNSIQNWVDLIFGSKAKGKEAECANNLFSEASYQESVNIEKMESKESYLRMVEFGLIPTQIMSKDCPKREKKEDLIKGKEITDRDISLKNYCCKQIKDQQILNSNLKDHIIVLIGGEFSPDKITLMLNNYLIIEKKITYSIFDKGFNDEIANLNQLNITLNKMGDYYTRDFNKKAIQFCNKGKILVMGGFYDGKIVIFNLEGKKQVELIPFNDDCPILSLHIPQDEDYLLVGNSVGNVAIYKIEPDINNWKQIKIIPDQKSAISHIYCNSDLNMWVSTSIDGYINLYTLPLCKLARTIKVSSHNCSYSFLASSPLPSIVIINDESNSEIRVYSINGKLMYKHELYFKLSNPILIKDLNSNENLAYIGKDGITILSLPTLETLINVNMKSSITTIFTSEDRKSLYCINKTGSDVHIIRDEIKKNIRAASISLMNI